MVAEPKQEDGYCADVGFVEVSVWDLLNKNENIIERDFDLRDADTDGLQVGSIKLTVKGLSTLKSVYSELKEKKTEPNHSTINCLNPIISTTHYSSKRQTSRTRVKTTGQFPECSRSIDN